MAKVKARMESGKGGGASVELRGLDELLLEVRDMERALCAYDRFAEDVLLSCVMPEVPRYVLSDEEYEGSLMMRAHDALQSLLVRYRRLVSWMRSNGIDPGAVSGEGGGVKS